MSSATSSWTSLSTTAIRWPIAAAVLIATIHSATGQANQPTAAIKDAVSLDLADLPPANVEIDLDRGLIQHSLGLVDAAIGGFMEGLSESSDEQTAENMKFVAQQITSAQELGKVVGEVVQHVSIRAWEKLPADSALPNRAIRQYAEQLQDEGWESTVRARKGSEVVNIFVRRDAATVSGVFIIAAKQKQDGSDLAMVNLVGDLSAENVHRLTAAATKIGVRLGLDDELNKTVEKLKKHQNR